MSENDSLTINDLMEKLVKSCLNVETLTETVKTIDGKLNQPKSNNEDDEAKIN